jgi:hypothetical protein
VRRRFGQLRAGRTAAATALLACLAVAPSAAAEPLPSEWHKGATLTSWWHDEYEGSKSDEAIAALQRTGSTDMAVLTTWYMQNGSSSAVAPVPEKTPSDAGILKAMAKAKSLGMRVTLKPHVDVLDGTFRANIAPTSPTAWFASYRAMLLHYAELARSGGAHMLMVGTELTSMSRYTAEWRQLIAEVRARFEGRLTFAANHISGAAEVAFWDDLDLIGIDAYMPLSSGDPNPSVEDLANAWVARGYVRALADMYARYCKPVVFTEIGYQSREGTATTPWEVHTGAPSQEAQRRAYEAAYRVWSRVPWFQGFLWWNWPSGGYNPGDTSHEPRGKAAEETMRTWHSGAGVAPVRSDLPTPQCGAPSGPPQAIPASAPGVDLQVKGKRRKLATVRLRSGGAPCAGAAAYLRLERRAPGSRRWRRYHRLKLNRRNSRRFSLRTRRLARGRYRGRAWHVGPGCPVGSSRTVGFRVRRRS